MRLNCGTARYGLLLILLPFMVIGCTGEANPTPPSSIPTQATGTGVTGRPPVASFPAGPTARTTLPGAAASPFVAINPVSSCPPLPRSEEFETFAQFGDRLRCVVNDFPWPPGRKIDVEGILKIDAGAGSMQAGIEYTVLTVSAQCAWAITWLDARQQGDHALEQQALSVIVNIIPRWEYLIPGMPSDLYGPNGGTIRKSMAQSAQLGDPSVAVAFVDGQGCRTLPWITS